MVQQKKTLILDANDILFSTQFIYMMNIETSVKADDSGVTNMSFDLIKRKLLIKRHSFFQSLIRRELEYIVTESEFIDIMKFAEYKKILEEGIILRTPYSRYMLNLNKMVVDTDIVVVYKTEIEKFLLDTKIADIADKLRLVDVEGLDTLISGNNEASGLATSDTALIDKYINKIDIMIPDTLAFLKKYHNTKGIYPIKGLWMHIQ